MAAAARPGASDARVPCPLCGGLIHPIAGKCKHCKADLAGYQQVRPAANAPLPALSSQQAPARTANGHDARAHGPPLQISAQPLPVPLPAPAPRESPPVLPPRPSARAATAPGSGSAWRSWPVFVIVLAMMAIVAAVVLMVWPADERRGTKRALQPPPAPEPRMQTEPTLPRQPRNPTAPSPRDRNLPNAPGPSGAQDPWAAPDSTAPMPPAPPPRADLTAPMPSTPGADPSDLAAQLGGGDSDPGLLYAAMLAHMCQRLIDCHIDDRVTSVCRFATMAPAPVPANCPAAARCLRSIDQMSCASNIGDAGQLSTLLTQFTDCAEATNC